MAFSIVSFIFKLFFIATINQTIYLREYGLLLSEVITLPHTVATMPPTRYYLFIKLRTVKSHSTVILAPLLGPEFLQKRPLLKRHI
jgi:hypothetical protein